MKNWNRLEADINPIMNKHYTPGRDGNRITKIVVHHNCGNLTTRGCYDVWQNRETSAHYQVEGNGTIGQLVWDVDTAWHAGNWDANLTSIGIEHANNHIGHPWTISEATLDNGAHLVAALCHYYELGRPTWGVNVFGHKTFTSTDCPGEIAASQHGAYMARAQYRYDHMNGTPTLAPAPAPAPKPAPAGKSIDDLAREVINGAWGNGEERHARLTSAGYNYDMVQTRVNQLLGTAPVKKPAAPPAPNIDALADAVIRGDYGNGDERRRLGGLYDHVQARVNTKLST